MQGAQGLDFGSPGILAEQTICKKSNDYNGAR
jgi:hypothetical protein